MDSSMAPINAALGSLRSKRKELLDQAAKLAESIATIEETFGLTPQPPPPTMVAIGELDPDAPYRGMTIGDAAVLYIRGMGKFQKTRDIADALEDGGLESKSVNLYRTVYNTLLKRSELTLKDAKWGLKEWVKVHD